MKSNWGFIGIDVGTTTTKAGLVDESGRELGWRRTPTPWQTVPSGAQAVPAALSDTAIATAVDLACRHPEVDIAGIGVTSIAETGVLADRAMNPLWAAIAWHDLRSRKEAEDLARVVGREWFGAQTGLILRERLSAVQYRWLRVNHPATRAGVRWFSLAEWIAVQLGGMACTDLSLAARTGFVDVHTREMLAEVRDWARAPVDLLGEPTPSGTALGAVTNVHPRLDGAMVTVAGHDHLCAAFGAGVSGDSDLFVSCGTAEACIRWLPAGLSPRETADAVRQGLALGIDVDGRRWTLLGGLPTGRALKRVLALLGVNPNDLDARARLEDAPASGDAPFIADVMEDTMSVGGIGWSTQPVDVWLAALGAVAGRSFELVQEMRRYATDEQRMVAAGGWSRSEAFMQAKSNCFGPVERSAVTEPGTRGAALLAGRAVGALHTPADLAAPHEVD